MAKPPLGTGQRFSQLTAALAQKPGVHDPAALAAFIGRKKFGSNRMSQMASAGKKGNA